jgi:hypothetical protein
MFIKIYTTYSRILYNIITTKNEIIMRRKFLYIFPIILTFFLVSCISIEEEPENNPPIANAGEDFCCSCGETFTLDAGDSDDPDGDSLEYEWTIGNDAYVGKELPLSSESEGVYTAYLEVSDGIATDTDSVVITIEPKKETVEEETEEVVNKEEEEGEAEGEIEEDADEEQIQQEEVAQEDIPQQEKEEEQQEQQQISYGINIVSLTSPISRGSQASITINTAPNVRCTITVYYKSGPSKAKGLDTKNSDSNGNCTWSWKVGTRTTPGNWRIVLTAEGVGQTETTFTVIE